MLDLVSLSALAGALVLLAHVTIYVGALGVIPGPRKPSTAMAWLILILAVPFLGFLVFLLFGSTRVERKRQRAQAAANAGSSAAPPRWPTSWRAVPSSPRSPAWPC